MASLSDALNRWRDGDPAVAARCRATLFDPGLNGFLADGYRPLAEAAGGDILAGPAGPLPAAVFPAPAATRDAPDAVLGPLSASRPLTPPPEFEGPGHAFLNALAMRRPGLWNGDVLCMERMETSTRRITCARGRYFDALVTADLIAVELLNSGIPTAGEAAHPLRTALHRRGNPLVEAAGRPAAIGISCLIVAATPGGPRLILRFVRAKHPGAPVQLHAIPSLMFQAFSDPAVEYSVRHNVFREYLEEVFGHPETDHIDPPPPTEAFYGHPDMRFLAGLIRGGGAHLELLGMAVDLLRLRPEVCTLLRIDDPAWWARHRTGADGLTRLDVRDEGNGSRLAGDPEPAHALLEELAARHRMIALPLELSEVLLRGHLLAPPGAATLAMAERKSRAGR